MIVGDIVGDISDQGSSDSVPGVNLSLAEQLELARQNRNDDETSSSSSDDDSSSSSNREESSNKGSRSGSISMSQLGIESSFPTEEEWTRTKAFRRGVILVFVCLTISATLAVFFISQEKERDSFETSFLDLSTQVINNIEYRIARKLAVVDSMGIGLTSYCMNQNVEWPFVTVPDFDMRAKDVIGGGYGGVLSVGIHPLVNTSENGEWGNYTQQHITDWPRQSGSVWEDPNYQIWRLDESGSIIDEVDGPFLPTWQTLPSYEGIVNFDILSHPINADAANQAIDTKEAVFAPVETLEKLGNAPTSILKAYHIFLKQQYGDSFEEEKPLTTLFYPIFDKFDVGGRNAVGVFSVVIDFQSLLTDTLPPGTGGILCVINGCGESFSMEIQGQQVLYLGPQDVHNENHEQGIQQNYDFLTSSSPSSSSVTINGDFCPYSLQIYPQDTLRDQYITTNPWFYALIVVVVLLALSFVACMYDRHLNQRMNKVIKSAQSSRDIVSSLFPRTVCDRLLLRDEDARRNSFDVSKRSNQSQDLTSRRGSNETTIRDLLQPFDSMMAGFSAMAPPKMRLKSFLFTEQSDVGYGLDPNSEPIADLFPHCTVLFADIEGFTAWSSEREPGQVFTLLQTIFQAFDHIARKRDVFKVETIGDCYVAVTGLPDPQADHAVRMTKFARSCLRKVNSVTKELEVTLGPGTGDIRMRFGLHSGPVTAGVLRGEKSRFQLFGDTVKTASRMESSGQANRIQISVATAHLLIDAGKENWVLPREDQVETKRQGHLQSFWVLTKPQSNPSVKGSDSDGRPKFIPVATLQDESELESKGSESAWGEEEWNEGDSEMFDLADEVDRQIDWQVDLLLRSLNQIVAGRGEPANQKAVFSISNVANDPECTILEEVSESIELPKFDPRAHKARASVLVGVPDEVVSELREFVERVAARYRDNPFHNFAHAIHVTMSANKLLSRIVQPELVNYHRKSVFAIASDMHDYTFGITSDPLTHFAIMFSTLVHDVDHTGVSNQQRNEEEPSLAGKYKSRSIAEQNSVDVAWKLLMDEDFENLRQCLFPTETELKRFRQILVNLVMATDIFEREMKATRDMRWKKVFHSDHDSSREHSEFKNLKATIVIEHIIQAADVSHTMQHWKVYTKWNECLFKEMYLAYEAGRSEKDPSEGWYDGELWFFDNYVIPLARKLEECRVFGVASDECLNYALENRRVWAARGKDIVKEMINRVKQNESNGDKLAGTGNGFWPPNKLHNEAKANEFNSKPVMNKSGIGNLLENAPGLGCSSISPSDGESTHSA